MSESSSHLTEQLGEVILDCVKDIKENKETVEILDLCCGSSEMLKFLAEHDKTLFLHGMDDNVSRLQWKEQKLKEVADYDRYRLSHLSLKTSLPFANVSKDLVFAYNFSYLTASIDKTIKSALRVLRPDGTLVLAETVYPELSWKGVDEQLTSKIVEAFIAERKKSVLHTVHSPDATTLEDKLIKHHLNVAVKKIEEEDYGWRPRSLGRAYLEGITWILQDVPYLREDLAAWQQQVQQADSTFTAVTECVIAHK